jgi:hypothetical protein
MFIDDMTLMNIMSYVHITKHSYTIVTFAFIRVNKVTRKGVVRQSRVPLNSYT